MDRRRWWPALPRQAILPVHLDEPVAAVLVSQPPPQEEVPDRDLASTDAHVRSVEMPFAAPCAIHLYVEDADATYARAVEAGATSVYSVTDQPWGDRQGAVKDQFGNHWYIAKPIAWTPGPQGLRSVQPFLHLRESHKMVPFLEAAFGAEALGVAKSAEGIVLHGTMRIGNATLEIDEAPG